MPIKNATQEELIKLASLLCKLVTTNDTLEIPSDLMAVMVQRARTPQLTVDTGTLLRTTSDRYQTLPDAEDSLWAIKQTINVTFGYIDQHGQNDYRVIIFTPDSEPSRPVRVAMVKRVNA